MNTHRLRNWAIAAIVVVALAGFALWKLVERAQQLPWDNEEKTKLIHAYGALYGTVAQGKPQVAYTFMSKQYKATHPLELFESTYGKYSHFLSPTNGVIAEVHGDSGAIKVATDSRRKQWGVFYFVRQEGEWYHTGGEALWGGD
jgi:hypothetical protein